MASTINASTSSGLAQSADTSGNLELQSDGSTKLTVASTGVTIPTLTTTTLTGTTITGTITNGTAVASTSGTAIDFTGIPSWVKRVTVMFAGTSLSGITNILIQLGTGPTPTWVSSGYVSIVASKGGVTATSTSGFIATQGSGATANWSGNVTINNITSNTWVATGMLGDVVTTAASYSESYVALGAALTAIRITTTGADTFDAGSINIQYEG